VTEIGSHATIIIDKFHVLRLANAALETIRNEQRRRLTRPRRLWEPPDRQLAKEAYGVWAASCRSNWHRRFTTRKCGDRHPVSKPPIMAAAPCG
jgi:transposase